MLDERHNSESLVASDRPRAEKLKKRRDQNRVSQRAFRLRKEKHTMELEAKVEELEALLETASHENSKAAYRMSKMEGELSYHRGLLYGSGTKTNSGITTSYPIEYQHTGNQFGIGKDEVVYSPVTSFSYTPAMRSVVAPAMAGEYQRAGSYDSSITSDYSPMIDAPPQYSMSMGDPGRSPLQKGVDSSMHAYLQFNTSEPVGDDGLYHE